MTDHLVHLPEHYVYCYQFADGKSNERCAEACMAMVGQIAFPGRWQNPIALMDQLYTQYVGPDVPTDRNGTSKEQVLGWLEAEKIGHIDMTHLLSDLDTFKHEIQAQNAQSVCQIITVNDMSKLRYAKNDGLLYHWKGGGAGVSHVILRVGYSDDQGYGLYFDPAASPDLPHPLPISWQSILEAGIGWSCAIMPMRVDVPPAGFSYQTGQWPAPAPSPSDVLATVRSQAAAERQQTHALLDQCISQVEQVRTHIQQVESREDSAFVETLRALGLNI